MQWMQWLRFGFGGHFKLNPRQKVPSRLWQDWIDAISQYLVGQECILAGSFSRGPVVEVSKISKYMSLICPVDRRPARRRRGSEAGWTSWTWKCQKPIWHDQSQQLRCSTTPTRMPTICQRRIEMIAGGHMWTLFFNPLAADASSSFSHFSEEPWTIQTCLVFSSSKCKWSGLMACLVEDAMAGFVRECNLARNTMKSHWSLGCPLLKNHGWLSFLK